MQIAPTMMYAYPKNMFFPPIQEVVERTKDLLPLKLATGKRLLTTSSYFVLFFNISFGILR